MENQRVNMNQMKMELKNIYERLNEKQLKIVNDRYMFNRCVYDEYCVKATVDFEDTKKILKYLLMLLN